MKRIYEQSNVTRLGGVLVRPARTCYGYLSAATRPCDGQPRLAGFKVPKGVTFLPELPKTATGKVQKFVLRGGRAGIAAQ